MQEHKFVIRSFKSIVECDIPLALVNVFIGSNGCGKTNILEGLGVMSAAVAGRVDDDNLLRRGVRAGMPALYKNAFKDLRTPPHIQFDLSSCDAHYALGLNNPLEDPSPAWKIKSEHLEEYQKSFISRGPRSEYHKEYSLAQAKAMVELPEASPLRQLLEVVRDFVIYAPHTQGLRGLSSEASRNPIGLGGSRLAEAAEEVLKDLPTHDAGLELWEDCLDLVGWIDELKVLNSAASILSPSVARERKILGFQDRFMRDERNTLTGYDASEGALYMVFLLVLLLHKHSPRWFAIDNVDQALNPRLIREALRLICRYLIDHDPKRCLLLTLHNPSALDGLPIADDRIRLFAVDRNHKGHTVINRVVVTPELEALAKDKGWPLSRLWVTGHLGGVPNV